MATKLHSPPLPNAHALDIHGRPLLWPLGGHVDQPLHQHVLQGKCFTLSLSQLSYRSFTQRSRLDIHGRPLLWPLGEHVDQPLHQRVLRGKCLSEIAPLQYR